MQTLQRQYTEKRGWILTLALHSLGGVTAKLKNLTGLIFGRWKVIERAPGRRMGDGKLHTYWLCRCECGKIKETIASGLIHGSTKSCGCYAVECAKIRNRKEGTAFRNVLIGYKKGAQERGIEFQLSDIQVRVLLTETCYYCGQRPDKVHITKGTKEEFKHAGIDRLNSSIGYIMDNCVPCCSQCNYMKQDFSEEEFVSKCKQIARRFEFC